MDNKIDIIRKEIDEIDKQIVELLKRRTELALKVGEEKRKAGQSIYQPDREEEVLNKIVSYLADSPFPKEILRKIYIEIISALRSLQEPLSVAFLGPEGTFSEIATIQRFGSSINKVTVATITDVFKEVEMGKVDYGVVPVESSNGGTVGETLDALLHYNVKIVGEEYVRVSYVLASKEKSINKIKKLFVHPQSKSQCMTWIEENLGNIQIVEVASTAKAAEEASKHPFSAAICADIAAEKYKLHILQRNIEDNPQNYTRFWIISTTDTKPTGNDKTTIMCYIKDQPGALYKLLEPFYIHQINLTKIESRPSRQKPWDYAFFIDFEGHKEEEKVKMALEEVKNRVAILKIIGSYPKGRMPGE